MARISLGRKLVLEEFSGIPDGAGGEEGSWAGLGVLWADVTALSGGDRAGEAARLSSTGYTIIVRAAPQGAPSRPRPGQRFRDGARVFRIEAVAELDARARFLTCHASEELVS